MDGQDRIEDLTCSSSYIAMLIVAGYSDLLK